MTFEGARNIGDLHMPNKQVIIRSVLLFSFTVWLCACSRTSDITNIVIKGSDTEVNLVLSLAEEYMESRDKVSISVTGGGSGMGIASLINGKTTIANSSRAFTSVEEKYASENNINPYPTTFALDGLAVIVNEKNPIDSITFQELKNIYTAQKTCWEDMCDMDLYIAPYGRQSNSGTFMYFREEVLKADYAPIVRRMNGTAQIVEAIKTDETGIGYVGVGYVTSHEGKVTPGIKVLPIKKDKEYVSPLKSENIINQIYPLTRPLLQYTDGKPEGEVDAFIDFVLSERGQEIVSQNGYFPVKKHSN